VRLAPATLPLREHVKAIGAAPKVSNGQDGFGSNYQLEELRLSRSDTMAKRFTAMTDAETHGRVVVSTDGEAGAYIMVVLGQLNRVTGVLRDNGVPFWIDEDAISLDGKPEIAVINLGRGADAATVQRMLDQAA
jgi:hypothetical protein